MKRFQVLLFLLISTFSLYAQEKTAVAIMPFVASQPEYKNRAAQLQEMIIEILSKKSDINLLDRSKDTLLLHELDNQIREQSMDSKLVQQGKVLGAQNMIVGTLTNIGVTKDTRVLPGNTQPTTTYEAIASFSLQLLDVETGKIIKEGTFNSNDKSGFLGLSINLPSSTSEDAISAAMSNRKKQILKWINECYPPSIKILKIEDRDKKGYPETILITGVDNSLAVGTKLGLNEVVMMDAGNGTQLKRVVSIGGLKISEKQGDITVCKVTEGEKVIEDKMKANAQLQVVVK